jgi:hypothetical protein
MTGEPYSRVYTQLCMDWEHVVALDFDDLLAGCQLDAPTFLPAGSCKDHWPSLVVRPGEGNL